MDDEMFDKIGEEILRLVGKPLHYVLDGKTPVAEPNPLKWGMWYSKADRVVARTELSRSREVITVFVGQDLNWHDGEPILFETAIRGGREGTVIERRYSTWDDAAKGHADVVAKAAARRRKPPLAGASG